MSNITKNLLLALTLVCVIALIVFCIQLIVLNRGVTPAEPGTSVSGGSQQGSEDSSSGEDGEASTDGEDGEGSDTSTDGEDGAGTAPLTPRPPPSGTRRSILITPDSRLIIYSNDDLFEFTQGDLDWYFKYTGAGEAELEIEFTSVTTQQGIAAHAEAFLNNYANTTVSVYSGEEYIQDSLLRGYHVSARAGSGTYEAWLHDLSGSDLVLVFIIFYENDLQRDLLYDILSSLSIEDS